MDKVDIHKSITKRTYLVAICLIIIIAGILLTSIFTLPLLAIMSSQGETYSILYLPHYEALTTPRWFLSLGNSPYTIYIAMCSIPLLLISLAAVSILALPLSLKELIQTLKQRTVPAIGFPMIHVLLFGALVAMPEITTQIVRGKENDIPLYGAFLLLNLAIAAGFFYLHRNDNTDEISSFRAILTNAIYASALFLLLLALKYYGYYYFSMTPFIASEWYGDFLHQIPYLSWGLWINLTSALLAIGVFLTLAIPSNKTIFRDKTILIPIGAILIHFISILFAADACVDCGKDLNGTLSLKRMETPLIPRVSIPILDGSASGTEGLRKSSAIPGKMYEVDLLPENIEKIRDFTKNTRKTNYFLREGAYHLLYEHNKANWLIDEHKQFCIDALKAWGPVECTISILPFLKTLTTDKDDTEFLNAITDEKVFRIHPNIYFTLTKSFISQGRLAEAKTWYERAKKDAPNDIKKDWSFPAIAPFTKGTVSGKIKGQYVKGGTIGIFQTKKDSKTLFSLYFTALVDSKTISPDGTFTFTNLPEGTYKLGLLLPQGVDGRFTVKGGGLITIDSKHQRATINAEIIKITEKK